MKKGMRDNSHIILLVAFILLVLIVIFSADYIPKDRIFLSPEDQCGADMTFVCPTGYSIFDSSNSDGKSYYFGLDCQGDEYVSSTGLEKPYRDDNKIKVCKSQGAISLTANSLNKSIGRCQNIANPLLTSYYKIAKGGCVPSGNDCEAYEGESLVGYAQNNEYMFYIPGGWRDRRILCYNGQLWEEQGNWPYATDVAVCTIKGNWYVNQSGFWNQIISNECAGIQGGLVAYYSFENGNASDFSGNNYHGEEKGGVNFSSDSKIGSKSANFDGVNDFIRIQNFNAISEKNFSISFWAKPNFSYNDVNSTFTPGFIAWINSSSSNFVIYQNQFNLTVFLMNTNNGNNWSYDSFEFSSGEWIFITAVYNKTSDRIKLYVNGEEASLGSGLGNNGLNGSAHLTIGKAYNYYFKGLIDDLKIYDKALTEDEILDLCGSDCGVDLSNKPLIYLTNSEWNGNFTQNKGGVSFSVSGSSGLARADYICEHDDNKPFDDREFRALLGTNSREVGDSGWVLIKNTSYYRFSDGLLIAETNKTKAWFDFPLTNSISTLDEIAATGLNEKGNKADDNCDDWSRGDNLTETTWGGSNKKTFESINETTTKKCDGYFKLYCVEQLDSYVIVDCVQNFTQCGNWSDLEKQCGEKVCYDINNCDEEDSFRIFDKDCSLITCGDGICNSSIGENSINCQLDCNVQLVCGNGEIEGTEECDDNNVNKTDGCSKTCKVESGWVCNGEPSECSQKSLLSKTWIYIVIIILIILAILLIVFLIYRNIKSRNFKNEGVNYPVSSRRPPGGESGERTYVPAINTLQVKPSPTRADVPKIITSQNPNPNRQIQPQRNPQNNQQQNPQNQVRRY